MDDLHIGGILTDVYTSDSLTTWSASLYCIGYRSQVYDSLLEELPDGHGYGVDNECCILSIDGWSVREDHIGVRGHVAVRAYVLDLNGSWEEHLPLVEFRLQQQLSSEYTNGAL